MIYNLLTSVYTGIVPAAQPHTLATITPGKTYLNQPRLGRQWAVRQILFKDFSFFVDQIVTIGVETNGLEVWRQDVPINTGPYNVYFNPVGDIVVTPNSSLALTIKVNDAAPNAYNAVLSIEDTEAKYEHG